MRWLCVTRTSDGHECQQGAKHLARATSKSLINIVVDCMALFLSVTWTVNSISGRHMAAEGANGDMQIVDVGGGRRAAYSLQVVAGLLSGTGLPNNGLLALGAVNQGVNCPGEGRGWGGRPNAWGRGLLCNARSKHAHGGWA